MLAPLDDRETPVEVEVAMLTGAAIVARVTLLGAEEAGVGIPFADDESVLLRREGRGTPTGSDWPDAASVWSEKQHKCGDSSASVVRERQREKNCKNMD